MKRTDQSADWTGGDPVTADLLDLASGRGLAVEGAVTSEFIDLAQHHGLIGLLSPSPHRPSSRRSGPEMRRGRRSLEDGCVTRWKPSTAQGSEPGNQRSGRRRGISCAVATELQRSRPIGRRDVTRCCAGNVSRDSSIKIPEKRPKADKRDIAVKDVSGVRFNLDLHWDLFDYTQLRGAAEGAVKRLWKSASHYPDSPLGPLWEIPDWGKWGFLAAHSVLDHRFRLILFHDFVELSRHPVDWEALIENARTWGLRSVTYTALWIGNKAVGAEIPDEVLRQLRPVSETVTFLERQLPRVDIARFDGRSIHPVNLASVLLNDSSVARVGLAVRAPTAFPSWRRRSAEAPERSSSQRILLVVASDARRGAEVFAERLQSGMKAKGLMPRAVSLTTHSNGSVRANVEALTDVAPSEAGRLHPRITWALRRAVIEFEPDAGLRARRTYAPICRFGYGRQEVKAYIRRYRGTGLLDQKQVLPLDPESPSQTGRSGHRSLIHDKDTTLAVEPSLTGRVEVAHTGVPSDLFQLARLPREEALRVGGDRSAERGGKGSRGGNKGSRRAG